MCLRRNTRRPQVDQLHSINIGPYIPGLPAEGGIACSGPGCGILITASSEQIGRLSWSRSITVR